MDAECYTFNCMEANMRLSTLTFLAFNVNMVIDLGRRVPISEMRRHLQELTVFDFLESKFKDDYIDLSIADADIRSELSHEWRDMDDCIDTDRKMGVSKDGLCLIVAFILESIQRRYCHPVMN